MSQGQLGNGTKTKSTTPVEVVGLGSGVTAVSGALLNTCAITSGQELLCWGDNTNGQLGTGNTTGSTTPVQVAAPTGQNGTQPSLRVLDVLNPSAAPTTFNLGDIDGAVVRNAFTNQVYVVNNAGVAYGFDLETRSQVWSLNIGDVSGFLVPVGTGFVASTATGVQRYSVDTQTQAVTAVWASPAPITGPSAPRIDFAAGKLYVSDATGKVHRLDLSTGAKEAELSISTQGLGMPSLDVKSTPKRLYVGGLDGRLCAINLPW